MSRNPKGSGSLRRVAEQDQLRRDQIARQFDIITTHVEFLQSRGLVDEFNAFQEERSAR